MLFNICFTKHIINNLGQGWPTQIGLWTAFRKFSKNIDFLDHFMTKTEEKQAKQEKSPSFD
jgi:hypothetical protein